MTKGLGFGPSAGRFNTWAIMRGFGMVGSGVLIPLLAAYRDTFTSVSGTLNGRTITGLAQYTTVLDSTNGGSTVNALNVTTTGKGTLAGTSANSHAHGYGLSIQGTDNYAFDRVLGTVSLEHDVSANGTTNTKLLVAPSLGFNVAVSTVVADTTVTTATLTAESGMAGDCFESRRVTINGADYAEVRVNGRVVMLNAAAYTAASVTGTIGAQVTSGSTSGTTCTVVSLTGVITAGDTIVYTGRAVGTVLPYGTNGTTGTGGTGTYALSASSTIGALSSFYAYSNVFNISAITSGTPAIPMTLMANSVYGYHEITGQLTGTAGSTGKYSISGNASYAASGTVALSYGRMPLGSVAATGFHGWLGNAASASVDSHEAGDMTKVSRITITRNGRVQALESDGTCILRGTFEYTGRAPTALKSEIHLASDNSIVAGTAAQPVTFTVDDTTKTGTFQCAAFTPASATTQYFGRIYREDAVDYTGAAAQIGGETGYFTGGLVILTMGQSLMSLSDAGTTVTTWAAPSPTPWTFTPIAGHPYTWGHVSGALSTNYAGKANTPPAALLNTILAAYGSPVVSYITTAIGGTYVYDRAPGGVQYEAAYTALKLQGLKPSFAIHQDGQQDVATVSNYAAKFSQIYPGLAALSGSTFPVFVIPLEAMWGYADAAVESVRRYQAFELPASDSRYHVAAFTMDLQHAASDSLHLTGDNFGETQRRVGWAVKNNLNSGTYPNNRLGPSIASAARIDAQTIAVTLNLNGFTGLSASAGLGTNGKTDQWNGGLRFGTAVGTSAGVTKSDGTTAVSTITTEVYPTNCVIGSPSGGQVVVTYTFASGTFPGTAYIGGPYGANPFNRTNDATVNASFASLASMLLGTLSGETSVAVQPYWSSTLNDYLSAS